MNARTLARAAGRRTVVPNEIMQAKFVDLLRSGESRTVAARAVGSTASRFRALERRDPDFGDLVADAVKLGDLAYEDRLRAEIRSRAFNRHDPASARLLEKEIDARLPEYEHRRTTRVGNIAGEKLEIGANARISAEDLAALPADVLEDLLRLKDLERRVGRGELRAIEGGGP